MMNPTRFLVAALASAMALTDAGAQDTLNLLGKVTSVAGTPISGVEVRIDGSKFVTRSRDDGTFAFVKAPKGPQLLLLRLLGYLPAKAEVRVPTAEPVEVTMLATPHNLDTVRVVASLNVLAGVVVDHKDLPIPGATVEMLAGSSSSATTDSSGWFTFTSVKSGSVLVRARKLGFAPATTSIRLEDWRGVVIHLDPIDDKLSGSRLEQASGFGNTAAFVWNETQARLVQRTGRAIVIPREELAQWDDFPLGQAIVRTATGSAQTSDLNAAGNNICVLLNGRNAVGSSNLQTFRTEDVEFVELYPPGTENSGTVARYLRSAGCRRVQVPGSFTAGVYYAVVWLRT
jgi:hypothetical protein